MEKDFGPLQKKEGLVFFKLFIAFLFFSLSVYGQMEIDAMKERAINIPGVSRNASFYPVSFKNETERNLYLCISLSSYLNQPVLYVLINSGDYVQIELLEGAHYFSFMDLNGNPRGKRNGGELLYNSSEDLSVVIDEKNYLFENTFYLDVIASDDQVIRIDNDSDIIHNSDKSDGEKFVLVALSVFGLLLLLLIIGAALEKK